MATLTIRNRPDAVRDKLRVRAAENGRSMEAEARLVLESSVAMVPERRELSPEEVRRRVRAVQEALRPYKRAGENVVDEFLADRRRMWGEE